jgi:spectrin alpha
LKTCHISDNEYFFDTFRNQEHRTEIDARAGTFQAFELFGQHLLQSNHYASPEVQEKLETMNAARQDLEK